MSVISGVFYVNVPQGKEPPTAYKTEKSAVLSLSVIKNYSKRDEPGVWYTAKIWGKLAEILSGTIKKGDKFYLAGSLEASEYNERVTQEIRVFEIERVTTLPLTGTTPGDNPPATEDITKKAAEPEKETTENYDDIPF
jgi:single-stranded DNA-binding protein